MLNNDLIDRFELMLEENEHFYFDGEELNEIINYYLDVGDLPFAHKAIEYALQLHPDSIDMRVKVLEYLIEVEMLQEAAELIEELKVVAENNLDFVVAQARYWSLKGQHSRAIKFYKIALEFDIENDYIHHCIGAEYFDNQEIGKALYHYKQALEIDLDDDMAFFACIQCFDEIHRHKDCIDFLLQYIDLRPYSDDAWFQLGLEYQHIKEVEKALEAFDYAVCINPKSINSLMQVAWCHEQLDEYDRAIEIYIEALEYDDSPAYTLMKIAHCYLEKNENSKALAYFHKAIHEDPQMDKAWSEISNTYESMGNIEEAIHYLLRAIELDAMQVGYQKRLAFLYIQSGKYEEAEKCFEKILKLEPAHFTNWLGHTELLIILGEYSKAIEVAEKGLRRFERAELYYQISCCEYLLNNNNKGFTNLLRAKKLNSKILDEMLAKYPILRIKNNVGLNKKKITK